MVQHSRSGLHYYLRQPLLIPSAATSHSLGQLLEQNCSAAVNLEFTVPMDNKRESNGHIPSHKLAVSKVTYMCIWLETAGSVITANYMLIT